MGAGLEPRADSIASRETRGGSRVTRSGSRDTRGGSRGTHGGSRGDTWRISRLVVVRFLNWRTAALVGFARFNAVVGEVEVAKHAVIILRWDPESMCIAKRRQSSHADCDRQVKGAQSPYGLTSSSSNTTPSGGRLRKMNRGHGAGASSSAGVAGWRAE